MWCRGPNEVLLCCVVLHDAVSRSDWSGRAVEVYAYVSHLQKTSTTEALTNTCAAFGLVLLSDQWLKWSCEAGGAHLTKPGWSKSPYPFHTQLIWRYLGIK